MYLSPHSPACFCSSIEGSEIIDSCHFRKPFLRKRHLEVIILVNFFLLFKEKKFYFIVVKVFLHNSAGKESASSARDTGISGLYPWVWKIPWRGGHGNPLQYSCLENPMHRRAWWATVHGDVKNWT